jgi:hypothetical protein
MNDIDESSVFWYVIEGAPATLFPSRIATDETAVVIIEPELGFRQRTESVGKGNFLPGDPGLYLPASKIMTLIDISFY